LLSGNRRAAAEQSDCREQHKRDSSGVKPISL
jgi:hypothetical protein